MLEDEPSRIGKKDFPKLGLMANGFATANGMFTLKCLVKTGAQSGW